LLALTDFVAPQSFSARRQTAEVTEKAWRTAETWEGLRGPPCPLCVLRGYKTDSHHKIR